MDGEREKVSADIHLPAERESPIFLDLILAVIDSRNV